MKKILFILIASIWSYGSYITEPLDVIDIVAPPKVIMTKLSEIANDISYIPLETNENALIERIISLRVEGNYIYIATLYNILCYSKSGKFLYSLDKYGRGPDEYEFLLDFDVNTNNTILAIPSRKHIVLYKQSDEGFTFLKRINIFDSTIKIDFVGKSDNLLVQYANSDGLNKYSRQLIDIDGKVLSSWPNYMMYKKTNPNVRVTFAFENTSYKFQDNLFIKLIGNDTIFRFNEKNTFGSFLVFNKKDKKVTPELRANTKYFSEHYKDYIIMEKIFGSARFFYYTYEYSGKIHHEIYDQLKEIRYGVPQDVFLKDDISGGVNFEPEYSNDGLLYSWIEPLKLKEFVAKDSWGKIKVLHPEKKTALKKLADSLDDFDNPVLIMVKFNE